MSWRAHNLFKKFNDYAQVKFLETVFALKPISPRTLGKVFNVYATMGSEFDEKQLATQLEDHFRDTSISLPGEKLIEHSITEVTLPSSASSFPWHQLSGKKHDVNQNKHMHG